MLLGHTLAYERREAAGYGLSAGAHFDSRTFFKASVKNDRLHISNFSTIDFSFLAEWWQKRLAPGVRPVDSLADIEEAYVMIVQLLDGQLSRLGKEQSAANRIYLLNLIMARKQNWLPLLKKEQFDPKVQELALPLAAWWDAGVPIEYVLHFFNPYIGGGFIKSGNSLFSTTVLDAKNHPALSLHEAKEAVGIPIAKLRVLYPNGAERF